MDGETVMMSIEKGEYFGIGGVGSRVWELLENPVTLEDIIETICEEYEVDAAACSRDIKTFLEKLLQTGLVQQE
jgi:hypothetical protein